MVVAPRPALAQAYAVLFFGVGSRHEAPRDNGITHVLEHMLFRGTKSFPDATALNAAAEGFGGFLEGATYRDHLMFATAFHPSALREAVGILGELVQLPRYRSMEVEKQILREELLETVDRDGRMIDMDNIAHAAVFAGHPLGWPIEGEMATLERLTRADLEAHRRRALVARNAVLGIAGAVEPEECALFARQSFGRMPAGAPSTCEPPPGPPGEPILRYVRNTSSQVELRLSFFAVPMQDPAYPALVLLARLLADGLASRMHAELVDRRGLAYALHAGLSTYADCGLFEFEVAVAPDKAAEAVDALLAFARGAQRFRFSDTEIARSLARYRYGMEFLGDDAADLASWHARAALFGIEHLVATLGTRLTRVRASDLHEVARRFFTPRGLVVNAVGELARGEWRRVREVVQRWASSAA